MKKKSIAFLCLGFNPPYGGNFIQSLLYLATKLSKYNIIFILSQDAKDREWIKEIKSKNISIRYVNTRKNVIEQSMVINKIIKDNSTILIHSHFTNQLIPCIISIINRKVKVLMHNHSDWSASMSSLKKLKTDIKTNFLYHFLGRRITIMAVSKSLATKYKVLYVPNGLDLNRIKKYTNTEIDLLKKTYKCCNSINLLIFAWSPYIKGLDVTINAAGLLLDKLQDISIKLLIVCGENSIENTKEYIDNNCKYKSNSKFLVFLKPTLEPYQYYAISDIYISSSRSEGFSYCLMEAISTGMPSIMSDIDGTSWAKEYGTITFISENSEDLANKIQNMILPSNNLNKYNTNQSLLLKNLSIDNWANTIIKIYNIK